MLDNAKRWLLIAPALLLPGCSVFGIATKGDLERQQAEIAAETLAVKEELQSVSQELVKLEQSLAPRLTSVEADLADLGDVRSSIDGLSRRLDDAKHRLTNVEGRTRQELERLDADLELATTGADEARAIAVSAEERGRQFSTAYVEGLRAERRRLQRELDEIEESIIRLGTESGPPQTALRGGSSAR